MAMTFESAQPFQTAQPFQNAQPFQVTELRSTARTYQPKRDDARHQAGQSSAGWRIKPVALVIAAAIVLVAVIGFGSDAAATGTQSASADIEIYIVQPGDTLWEIATEMAEPGEDVRQLVDALEEIAGGSQLDVGQRLIVDHMLIRK